jgi:hypothetical protein
MAGSNPYDRLLVGLSSRLAGRMKSQLQAQVEFATVKSVDMQEKTCTVQMLTDKEGVETEGIGLQFAGNCFIKPAIGSMCLIAHIMNDDSEGLIIWCQAIDELWLNGNENGGLIKKEALVMELEKVNVILSAIQQAFVTWQPVPNDGGAALKALSQSFTQLESGNYSSITNEKIKHGGN